MLSPRDLREAYERAQTSAGNNPASPATTETWRAMLQELAAQEARCSSDRTVELVVGTTGDGENIDWIDDQICCSFEAASQRLKEVKTFALHRKETGTGRRYLLRTLRTPRFEAGTPDPQQNTPPAGTYKTATVDEVRKLARRAEQILVPVLRSDKTSVLMQVMTDDVLSELDTYEDDDTAPWSIDIENTEGTNLVVDVPLT